MSILPAALDFIDLFLWRVNIGLLKQELSISIAIIAGSRGQTSRFELSRFDLMFFKGA